MLYALESSLKRLQVEHIDLYQIHGFDQITPIEETLRALETVVQQGKVRYIGVSNWAAWQIAKAVGISNQFNLARFASLQGASYRKPLGKPPILPPMLLVENWWSWWLLPEAIKSWVAIGKQLANNW